MTRITILVLCLVAASSVPISSALAQAGPGPADSTAMIAKTRSHPTVRELGGPEPVTPPFFALDWSLLLGSKYIFQGFDYSDGKAVMQPTVSLGAKGFSAVLWMNHDIDRQEPTETDLALQYGRDAGPFSVTGGYMHLSYPNRIGWEPSQEVFTEIALNGLLSPTLSIHYDFDGGDGSYNALGFSRSLPGPLAPFTVGSKLYYQRNYYELTGIPSVELNASTSWAVGPVSLSPSLSRFIAWENGGFRDESAIGSSWLFALNIAQND